MSTPALRPASGNDGLQATHSLTPFIGREDDVAALTALVTNSSLRLVTLVGPGGIGKTRLALQVANAAAAHFAAGVVIVPLVAVTKPEMVLPTIASALDVGDGPDRPLIERIASVLDRHRFLLVLDNMEQVIASGREIASLLRIAPGTTVLTTSRSPLRVDGEQQYPLTPLDMPPHTPPASPDDVLRSDAGAFFVQCARRVHPGFDVSPANALVIANICHRLDGLPLALELAAARTRLLSPEELLARLQHRLPLLTAGMRDRHPRQRTMRDAIAWSYDLLDPPLQALFRRLSLFRGGFSLDIAEQIMERLSVALDDEVPDTLDGIALLADQSLVSRRERPDGSSRFRMLETIREYGMEQLERSGEADIAGAAFATFWLERAEATWADAGRIDMLTRSLARLEEDHDSIRAALHWYESHDIARALEFAGALFWFWYVRGHHGEGSRELRRLLSRPRPDIAPGILARAQMAAGAFSHFQSDSRQARRQLEEALGHWREATDAWGTGFTLFVLGVIAEDTGDYGRARELLEEAVVLLDTAGDDASVGSARYHLAVVAFGMGELPYAGSILASLLDDHDDNAPVLRVAAWAHHLRGLVRFSEGALEPALDDLRASLRAFRAVSSPPGIAEGLAGLAIVAASWGDSAAMGLWGAAERLMEEQGDAFQLPEREVYETAMTTLRERIGSTGFAKHVAMGRAWTLDEAIEVGLGLEPVTHVPAADPSALAKLSGREREILRFVAEGWTNDQIAEHAYLSPRTVQTHLTSIYRKLNVRNRTEAARLVLERET